MTETRSTTNIARGGANHPEPGGRAPAPGALALVQRFINTWNQEFLVEDDQLGTTRAATAWLRANNLAPNAARPAAVTTAAELDLLRDLREAIRALATTNVTGTPDPFASRTINGAAATTTINFTIGDDGHLHLQPSPTGVGHAIGTLLTVIHDAQIAGDWTRLKGCRQCGYAFYDSSKNRSATWCSMTICGNRAKNRAYHQRRRNNRPET